MTALTLIAGLAFLPLTASAQVRSADSILRGQIQALHGAGFSGMTDVQMPSAPTTAATFPVLAQADETAEALTVLIKAAQVKDGLVGDTVRAMGFDFKDKTFPVKGITMQQDGSTTRFFSVTAFRDKTDIIMEELQIIDGKKVLRSYLMSPSGVLETAVLTKKRQADIIPAQEAQEGFQKLLGFWMRYYRDNLKNA
ncbi:MAG: hypothetical protein A2516_07410 [Alphaproteobacteria bacterium RIFOXYD12_FULL_60_8]|nr:MAG: hypothetical protein A2516_07410 [Alphaproteobacteria bacterium RIFOXYD12_FULL_60_8]